MKNNCTIDARILRKMCDADTNNSLHLECTRSEKFQRNKFEIRNLLTTSFAARGPALLSQIHLYAYASRDCRLSRGENKSTEENLPEGINVASRGILRERGLSALIAHPRNAA